MSGMWQTDAHTKCRRKKAKIKLNSEKGAFKKAFACGDSFLVECG